MEQQFSQLGVGTSNPQLNPDLGVNPTISESVPVNFDPLNPVVTKETLVNQLDEIDNPLDQFLSNLDNAQMIDKIIEKRKHQIFDHMVAQGMTIASSNTPVTASIQETPQ